jgi:hypothetical protein
MKGKVKSLALKYLGIENPETDEEVDFEVLGLKTAIAAAQQRLAILEQSKFLKNLVTNPVAEEKNEKTVDSAPTPTENK